MSFGSAVVSAAMHFAAMMPIDDSDMPHCVAWVVSQPYIRAGDIV